MKCAPGGAVLKKEKKGELLMNAMSPENINTDEYSPEYILSRALDIGENILKCGGEPYRIEDTITRICSAYGAIDTDVFALPSLIIAGILMPDGRTVSQVRRVNKTVNNMYRLDQINDISRRLCDGKISLNDVEKEIETVVNKKPFNKYLILLGGVLAAGGFAVFFGGTIKDAVAAAIAGFIISLFNIQKIKFGNQMLYTVLVSFFGAFTGLALNGLGLGDNIDMVMIGTIMLVIPGLSFGNAVRDLLFGDTVSGIIQLVQAVLVAVMVAAGFMAAMVVYGGVFG